MTIPPHKQLISNFLIELSTTKHNMIHRQLNYLLHNISLLILNDGTNHRIINKRMDMTLH